MTLQSGHAPQLDNTTRTLRLSLLAVFSYRSQSQHTMSTAALPTNIYPGAALVATGLAAHGLRKGSLSQSGAVAAWIVGYASLANPLKLFGSSLIVFYLVGSRATRVSRRFGARAGGWRLEAGVWRLEAGGFRLEAGGWTLEAGGWTLDAAEEAV